MLHKTLEDVLLHHTSQLIANSSMSQTSFICELLFPALTQSGVEKPTDILTADDYGKWESAKRRQLSSIMNGHTNVPAKWALVWAKCLPEPYGSAARSDMLAVFGVMDINLSILAGRVTQRSNLPALLRETAEVLDASAEVCADGHYDSDDDPKQLQRTADELLDVVELCLCEMMSIHQVTPLTGRASVVVKMFK